MVDLGCGKGRWTTHLVQYGYKITAIDPREEAKIARIYKPIPMTRLL
ncbi:methyltransferase domain-containing protein [Paenibacillus amylolyticus]